MVLKTTGAHALFMAFSGLVSFCDHFLWSFFFGPLPGWTPPLSPDDAKRENILSLLLPVVVVFF